MHDGQKFTYVVGAQDGTKVKLLLHVAQIDGAILHISGISAACRINGKSLSDNLRRQWFILLFATTLVFWSFLLYVVLGRFINSFFRLGTSIERFIYGTFPAFNLLFAGLPRVIYPRIQPNPNNIEFVLCHIYAGS